MEGKKGGRRKMAPLAPLPQKRGLQLVEHDAGNFILPAYPGLIVKDSYWRGPEHHFGISALFSKEIYH
jgi:hypothetical protein